MAVNMSSRFLALFVLVAAATAITKVPLHAFVPEEGSLDSVRVMVNGKSVVPESHKGVGVVILDGTNPTKVLDTRSFNFHLSSNISTSFHSHAFANANLTHSNLTLNNNTMGFHSFLSTASPHDEGKDVFVFTIDHTTPVPAIVRDVLSNTFGAQHIDEVIQGDSYVLVSRRQSEVPLVERFEPYGEGGASVDLHLQVEDDTHTKGRPSFFGLLRNMVA